MTVEELITTARCSLGTRFRHQGRSPSQGLDCAGLIIVSARRVGLSLADTLAYGRQPNPIDFLGYMERNGLMAVDSIAPGRIGLFDFGAGPQHVALFTPIGMIHAYAPARKVIEHRFSAPWPQRLCGIYAFPTLLNWT